MKEKHLINRKILIQFLMDNYQCSWKFHDLVTGISNLPFENVNLWISVNDRLPEQEGTYRCIVFNEDTKRSLEKDILYKDKQFFTEQDYVIVWKE